MLDHGDHIEKNSGAYLFRPIRGQYDAWPYGELKVANTSFNERGEAAAFNFLFEKDLFKNEHAERSMLTVRINDALKWQPASIQFDVTLDSLPFEA